MAQELATAEWSGEDVSVGAIEHELAQMRQQASRHEGTSDLRTSVMTHMAWVPPGWLETARGTLAGMAERHPSRTILLVPDPDAGRDALDAELQLVCFALEEADRSVCTEVVELHLRGERAAAPASIVVPLLIADLPVFLRWRGPPPFGAPELEQLVEVTDRLIVDSTEWPDLPGAYAGLVPLFERTAVSDIAWARTRRWRQLLASLWPQVAGVRTIQVRGTAAQAHLLGGWLSSRLGHPVEVEHDPAERLEAIAFDGEAAPFPPGDAPSPSELLSDELETYGRDPVYEQAVAAAGA